MDEDLIHNLPEWDDEDFDDDEGEEWKPNPTRDACKELYIKWREIYVLLSSAFAQVIEIKGETNTYYSEDQADLVVAAYEVGDKIRGSEITDIYVLKMEVAAIIRMNAQFINSSLVNLVKEKELEEEYCIIIRNEIDDFKSLFKKWITTFTRDGFEDEWGLFV